MRGAVDDDVAWGSERRGGGGAPMRTYGLVAGFVLAVAATIAVFLTDNPQYLRLAVLAAAWAFVPAAVPARRRPAARRGFRPACLPRGPAPRRRAGCRRPRGRHPPQLRVRARPRSRRAPRV